MTSLINFLCSNYKIWKITTKTILRQGKCAHVSTAFMRYNTSVVVTTYNKSGITTKAL